MACKSLNLNLIDHLLDLLERMVHAQPLQLNLRELTRVIHQTCAAIPQQYIHRHTLFYILGINCIKPTFGYLYFFNEYLP